LFVCQFDRNVVIQVKNGPMDFQVREPVSPLLTGALRHTNVMMEVQAAQEYTGQAVHAVGLTKQWVHYLNFDTFRHGKNSTLRDLLSRRGVFFGANVTISGMAAVSNLGDNHNLTGSILGQANTYGFGRLAWDPTLSSPAVNREWTLLTLGATAPTATVEGVVDILEQGWETYENYTSPRE
jgi:alpha-glucuronidase